MITCKFIGELGNNLFQLATLLSLKQKFGYEYCIPNYRIYWNDGINNKLEFTDLFEYNFLYDNINVTEYIHNDRLNINHPNFTHKYSNITTLNDNTCIVGYFQSDRYFSDISNELKNNFFKYKSTLINNIKLKYGSLSNTAILHVRRGRDRLTGCIYAKSFNQFEPSYYEKSVQYLKTNYTIDNTLVISDHIDWCKDNIKIKDVTFIENQSNIEDLVLYSLCKYNVLGNSTFSWWASWLNQNDDVVKISFPSQNYFVENSPLSKIDVSDMYIGNYIIL